MTHVVTGLSLEWALRRISLSGETRPGKFIAENTAAPFLRANTAMDDDKPAIELERQWLRSVIIFDRSSVSEPEVLSVVDIVNRKMIDSPCSGIRKDYGTT